MTESKFTCMADLMEHLHALSLAHLASSASRDFPSQQDLDPIQRRANGQPICSLRTFIYGCGDTGDTVEERTIKYWYLFHTGSRDSWESSSESEEHRAAPFPFEGFCSASSLKNEEDVIEQPEPEESKMKEEEEEEEELSGCFTIKTDIVAVLVEAFRAFRLRMRKAFRRGRGRVEPVQSPSFQEDPTSASAQEAPLRTPDAEAEAEEEAAEEEAAEEEAAEEEASSETRRTRKLRFPKFKKYRTSRTRTKKPRS
ncbi:uncharacterized protein LOC125785901 [Astyanax mexicanus]|uniref:uncharacterized protein LOC125785901 n=1 Tax=Astyanax mexicanus TaxID=7994 RepID=UPI0020CAD030|nr:uncharacterized protein LOC125785901 [Astyanax mexicanus]